MPCCIGLSRNAAASFQIAALWLTGIVGVRFYAISSGILEGWVDETLECDGTDGDVGVTRPDTLPVDREGERAHFGGDMVHAVDVAWCCRVGGAVTMTLAFAQLAAMAAATLLFFTCGVAS